MRTSLTSNKSMIDSVISLPAFGFKQINCLVSLFKTSVRFSGLPFGKNLISTDPCSSRLMIWSSSLVSRRWLSRKLIDEFDEIDEVDGCCLWKLWLTLFRLYNLVSLFTSGRLETLHAGAFLILNKSLFDDILIRMWVIVGVWVRFLMIRCRNVEMNEKKGKNALF